jgi:hypothetical protein
MVWLAFILTIFWLYDRWLVPGPHGSVHWVGMDFVPYWVGVRLMLVGQSPYSAATTQAIQSVLLGGAPGIWGDPMLFVYPAWIFLVIVPFALIPLQWAVAIWTGTLLFITLHILRNLASHWGGGNPYQSFLWTILLVIGSLPFISIAVSKGQLSIISLAALFLVLHFVGNHISVKGSDLGTKDGSLSKRREILIGIFLALSILKPTVTIPAFAGILLWAIIERKGWIIAGAFFFLGSLSLISMLAVGNWLPDYLAILKNTGGAPVLWSMNILTWPWNACYELVFAGLIIFAFIRFMRTRDFIPWSSITILAGLAVMPMRWIYDLLLGILIPYGKNRLTGFSALFTVVALLAPWGSVFLPEQIRWNALVISLPLIWACVWCFTYSFKRPGK